MAVLLRRLGTRGEVARGALAAASGDWATSNHVLKRLKIKKAAGNPDGFFDLH
jgi:hypothetical protein